MRIPTLLRLWRPQFHLRPCRHWPHFQKCSEAEKQIKIKMNLHVRFSNTISHYKIAIYKLTLNPQNASKSDAFEGRNQYNKRLKRSEKKQCENALRNYTRKWTLKARTETAVVIDYEEHEHR